MVCVYAKNAVGIGDKMMKIKTLILYTLLSLSMCGTVYAGPIVHRDGAVIPSGATLDIVDIDDGNVPAMQAAGAGFGESPIWRTDANTVTLKSATGQSITLAFNADNGEDNSDKWKLVAADGGNVTLQTYASGAWVTVAIWTNAGGLTLTGAIAGATVNTGQGAYELYAMNQDLESTDSVSFATITEGANAVPNATDPLSFFAATTSAQLAGVLSDETGTLKSVFSDSPTFTTQITTPAITAPAASLVIKPTTDAVNAVQVQDKDGNNILNVDTVNNRVGIGTAAPESLLHLVHTTPSIGLFGANQNADAASIGLFEGDGGWPVRYGFLINYDGDLNKLDFEVLENGILTRTPITIARVSGSVGIGTTAPDTRLHAEIDDATTNATTNVQTLTHTTSGTPAANIGAGLALEVETAAANNEVVGVIEGIASELATPGAEDGAILFKTMTAGAAASEKARITEVGLATQARTVKKTNVSDANYGTSALTSDYIVAFTSLSAARTATISTEDEDTGTTTQPRVMIFKDESGSAATYNITISLESGGTIDGAANFVIDQPYQSVTIYLNGTNGYIM